MPSWTKEQMDAIKLTGQNIIVSAGAGSGKTAVLTERVLKKIADGININELLILTFTNAAAKEMKSRIRKELKRRNLEEQLNLIDSSFITTFDSFALSIVKKYHYYLNVSQNISISDSTIITLEKERIIDEIFEKLYEEKNELFLKLIGDLCIKDDLEIKKYILSIDEKLNLKLNKQEFINNIINNYFSDNFIDTKLVEYTNLIKSKIEEIKQLLLEISYVSDSKYYNNLNDSLNHLLNSHTYEEIKKALDVRVPNLPRNSSDELKSLKENLSDLLKNVKQLCFNELLSDYKDNILQTRDYVTVICEILSFLNNEITKYKYKNELFEFVDIAKMSIDVIKNNESVKLDVQKKFKEIMVDEYQDTSDIQEEFINLIGHNNIYMVGDIKQSIYRFRNANPNIFKNKYEDYRLNNGGIKIDLNKNFRSRNEVLNNINLIFNYIMDNTIGGASYRDMHQMVFGNNLYEENKPCQKYDMEIMYYDYENERKYTKEEIEYFAVCKDIIQKINSGYLIYDNNLKNYRPCSYSDFSILIDRSTSFTLAKKIFEYHQIPLAIYLDENITNTYDLIIIKNILELMIKEKNKEYDTNYKYLFMSIARSFLFSYDDNTIFDIIVNNKIQGDYIISIINELLIDIDNATISQILFNLLKKFKFYENIPKVGNVLDSMIRFEYLNDVCKSLENIGYTLEEFKTYLSNIIDKGYDIKLSPTKDDSNSVKLMTIHKSKGLEFPICYFISLDKAFNLQEIKDKFTFSENYGIISPYFKNGIGKTIYVDLLKNDYLIEEISEKVRLFYVALTRAKEKMIFVLPNNISKANKVFNLSCREKYRSFADIIYSLSNYLALYNTQLDIENLKLTKQYNKHDSKKIKLESHNKIEFKEHKNETVCIEESSFSKKINNIINKDVHKNLELGLKFHECLEYIDFKKINIDIVDNLFIKNKIIKFLDNPLLNNLDKANVYKEMEFMYDDDNKICHGIIDLLMEYDDHIDIIDYKLKSIDDMDYKKQLLGYKKYISKIKNKPINIYLYSILKEEFKKIDI